MNERSGVLISIETDTTNELRNAVDSGLYAYNDQFAGPMHNSVLTIGARDADKKIIGGLVANLQPGWKWMHVHRLWVTESHRRAGIGRLLLEAAEKEAQRAGCLHVAVDTFEFQAREFYEKQGYRNNLKGSAASRPRPPAVLSERLCARFPRAASGTRGAELRAVESATT